MAKFSTTVLVMRQRRLDRLLDGLCGIFCLGAGVALFPLLLITIGDFSSGYGSLFFDVILDALYIGSMVAGPRILKRSAKSAALIVCMNIGWGALPFCFSLIGVNTYIVDIYKRTPPLLGLSFLGHVLLITTAICAFSVRVILDVFEEEETTVEFDLK